MAVYSPPAFYKKHSQERMGFKSRYSMLHVLRTSQVGAPFTPLFLWFLCDWTKFFEKRSINPWNFCLGTLKPRKQTTYYTFCADVVKLVDTLDLGSSAARRGGSSPSQGTICTSLYKSLNEVFDRSRKRQNFKPKVRCKEGAKKAQTGFWSLWLLINHLKPCIRNQCFRNLNSFRSLVIF